MIQEWITKHLSTVTSPIVKYTTLVRDDITGKKTYRHGKYLIQVSIRDLYNDLIKSKNKGDISEV